ncbi:MAG: phage terminase large subunit, partial [Patescibacteria group bacterium]|nr:phage terminase large subunit [Patescibacteria group bacterium]
MKNPKKINFIELSNFFPKQIEALKQSQNYKYLLYGGSMGSGKSRWLRWACLYYLLYYSAKYGISPFIGLFCRSYKELEDRHLKYVRAEFPDWLGRFNEAKTEFHLKPEYGGGILSFRNLDDPSKYFSAEFALVAVDELTQIPFEVFKVLVTRLRFPPITDTKFIAATNPIGEYFLWVREIFVEK